MDKRIVVLSGAGMSAESGISTFRNADGLWQGHKVAEVASPRAWQLNPDLVLDFYNERRRQLLSVEPNKAHYALVELAQHCQLSVVTQNVDDLHERAGNYDVLHLHGELLSARSTKNINLVYPVTGNIELGDTCELGSQLRPDIVWFGEEVPMLDQAIAKIMDADIVLIIGTSMQVYPAAGLVSFASKQCDIHYVDPDPTVNDELAIAGRLTLHQGKATDVVPILVNKLINEMKGNRVLTLTKDH